MGSGIRCGKIRDGVAIMVKYKVVELSTVSEDMVEETLNEWTAQGWHYEGMQFAMRESQKRPSMAFIIFTRDEG
jgi:hypothetical protein